MKWSVAQRMLLWLTLSQLLTRRVQSVEQETQQPPNFILIFTDDVGFGDLHCYGHPYARTPNIDRLAKEGTMFRQFHVNGNICPVTRSGLLTSRSPAWFPNYPEDYGFLGTTTVMNVLQRSNYTTGHIGKWNIGPDPAAERVPYGIDHLRVLGGSPADDQGRERARIDEAMAFVAAQHRARQPFYLNLWLMALHTPINPPQSFRDQFANLIVDRADFGVHMQKNFDRLEALDKDIDEIMRGYLADLLALDEQVGRLLDQLDELGLTNHTVVAFSSDNGPADVVKAPHSLGYAGGLRGGKHTYDEGGTRVPFLVRWPGRIPAGRVDDTSVMSALDWFTTVSAIATAPYDTDLVEGEDLSDVWFGATTRSRDQPLFFRDIAVDGNVYVRYGRWKWHDRTRELYDLHTDPFEQKNVAADRSDVAKELARVADDWVATLPSSYARLGDKMLPFDPMARVRRIDPPNLVESAFILPSESVNTTTTTTTRPSDTTTSPSEDKDEAVAAQTSSTTTMTENLWPAMLLWISMVLGLLKHGCVAMTTSKRNE